MNLLEWYHDLVETYVGDYADVVHIFVIVFLTLLSNYILKRLIESIEKRLHNTSNVWDDALVYSIRLPISIFTWLIGATFVLRLLDFNNIEEIREVGLILVIAIMLVRFIKEIEARIIRDREKLGEKIDRTTADAIAQLLRLSVIITATLVGLQAIGVNISAILAFGGIGGIAIGFAAKDLLSNFFGGLMVYLDRPFSVGDWIRSPDRNIEGTVEKIGWRLSIIRTFDKRPLYIPNSVFATISVENPSRMSHRRIYETIGIRYDDIAELPAIVADVKAMLQAHEEIAQDQTMIVNFNTYAASSLDFFVYTFTKTTNWIKYHEVKQDVLFKIGAIIEQHGAEIAFPTSTVHLAEAQLIASAAGATDAK